MLNAKRLTTKAKKGFTRQSFFKKNLVGFTLIELLIVITLFGLSTSLITASYLTFEKNQRVKTAALNLKNDIRLAQNYALSGNKGVGSGACSQPLVGWYVWLTVGPTHISYQIGGRCNPGSSQTSVVGKDVVFPKGVTVSSYSLGGGPEIIIPDTDFFILFQPLRNAPSFHNAQTAGSVPSFLTLSGASYVLDNLIGGSQPQGELVITLVGNGGSYLVSVNGDSGEVSASRN